MRRGPMSNAEKNYIKKNRRDGALAISKYLGRSQRSIQKYIDETFLHPTAPALKTVEYEIKKSPVWKDLQNQFSPAELELFLYHYKNIISQFKNDVFATEEIQVVDACKLEILMNRALNQQYECMTHISELETLLLKAKEDEKLDEISSLDRQITSLRAAQESLDSNHQKMLSEKNKLFKEMKATRDQRIKSLEASKLNFMTWLKRLLENKDLRIKLGREMEKMRLAQELTYERLSEYYQFGDNDVDVPLLTPENVPDD